MIIFRYIILNSISSNLIAYQSDYRRSFDIILLLAECQFNVGNSEEAEKNCALLLENGNDTHDKVFIYLVLCTVTYYISG